MTQLSKCTHLDYILQIQSKKWINLQEDDRLTVVMEGVTTCVCRHRVGR